MEVIRVRWSWKEIFQYQAANAKASYAKERRTRGRRTQSEKESVAAPTHRTWWSKEGLFSWLSDERQGARSGGVASVISSPQRVEGKAPSGNKDGQLLKKETPQVAPDITAAQGSELCPLQGEETLSVNVVSISYESFLDYIPHIYSPFESIIWPFLEAP